MQRIINYQIILLAVVTTMMFFAESVVQGDESSDRQVESSEPNLVELSGILSYNGIPMSEITDVEPSFWCNDADTGESIYARLADYDSSTGSFTVTGVPRSYVSLCFAYHICGQRWTLPGNYVGELQVYINKVSESEAANLTVEVERIIHMTSPQDNNSMDFVAGRARDVSFQHDSEFYLEWEPIDEAFDYDVEIDIFHDPTEPDTYRYIENAQRVAVRDNFYLVQLPVSEPNEHYQAKISAFNQKGGRIGRYLVTYKNGWGADYRFKVVQPKETD